MKRLFTFIFIMCLLFPVFAQAASVSLAWDASTSTGVTGYKIYVSKMNNVYGPSNSAIDVGNVLTYTVLNLDQGTTYYFVATAYNPGNESGYSNQVSTTTPWSVPLPPNMKPVVSAVASLDNIKTDLVNFRTQNTDTMTTTQRKVLNTAINNVTYAKINLTNFLALFVKLFDFQEKGLRVVNMS